MLELVSEEEDVEDNEPVWEIVVEEDAVLLTDAR